MPRMDCRIVITGIHAGDTRELEANTFGLKDAGVRGVVICRDAKDPCRRVIGLPRRP